MSPSSQSSCEPILRTFLFGNNLMTNFEIRSLSWCDTTASFFGRMYGARTPPLPRSLPIPFTKRSISLPFAKRKSLAGFIAAAVTGCLIGVSFWGWIAPLGATTPSWTWQNEHGWMSCARLAMVGIASGLVAGVAESLGTSLNLSLSKKLDR